MLHTGRPLRSLEGESRVSSGPSRPLQSCTFWANVDFFARVAR